MRSLVALLLAAALSSPFACLASKFVYISYAPDVRYSINGKDSKIVLNLESNGYGYGHDFGNLHACSPKASQCIVFDFMAIAAVPPEARPGSTFAEGEFTFEIGELAELRVLGIAEPAYLVTVKNHGVLANRYYFSRARGVIGIVAINFDNQRVPESVFFVSSQNGLFHAPPAGQEIK